MVKFKRGSVTLRAQRKTHEALSEITVELAGRCDKHLCDSGKFPLEGAGNYIVQFGVNPESTIERRDPPV